MTDGLTNSGKGLSIGFLLQESTGAGGFQDLVWHCMVESARRRGVNAFVFAGGSLESAPYNPFEKSLNLVYELVDGEHLDGLVVSNPIGNFVSVERFQRFCRDFRLPLVTVVGSLPGFPSVRVNNKSGLREAMFHLVEKHGARKIAFIKGSAGNKDAEERLAVFRETMKEAGLPVDPELVYDGLFNEDSGAEAVNYFVKERGKKPDAIVASNDAMALGAIMGLRDMGIQVPWDVMVTGFDDTVEARAAIPSLTTVRQPVDEICAAALDILGGLIEGKPVEESTAIPSRLVIRQSCGCTSALVQEAGACGTAQPVAWEERQDAAEKDQARILRQALRETAGEGDERLITEVVSAFLKDVEDVRGGAPPALLPKLQRIFQDGIVGNREISSWQRAFCAFRSWSRVFWTDNAAAARAEDVIFQAMVLAGEYSRQALAGRAISVERKAKDLTAVGRELVSTFDFDQLKSVVQPQLTLLRVPSCFISVFRGGGFGDEAELFTAYREGGVEPALRHQKHALPEKTFFPRGRRYTYAVHPLCFREHKLGYALFELGPEDGLVYNTLQVQISSSLMGAELIRQRERSEEAEKKRSDTVQELIRPMIDSIGEVTNTAREKIGMIVNLIAVTKENSEKLDSTNAAIKVMNEKIVKMSDVIGLIDDISTRVNVMAINTSIEAAHAGTYGKGFAVIAGEIRKLADSIKMNATMIAEYLRDIRPTIDGSRKAGESSREAFRRLEQDVADVAETLRRITSSMDELSRLSAEILSLINIS